MSKLKVSIKKSTVTAMMKAGRKERINETELSQLARIKPCGIMHVTKTKKEQCHIYVPCKYKSYR